MTGYELKQALRTLKLKQRAFASHINYREETVSRWVRDKETIPAVVIVAIRGMLAEHSNA